MFRVTWFRKRQRRLDMIEMIMDGVEKVDGLLS